MVPLRGVGGRKMSAGHAPGESLRLFTHGLDVPVSVLSFDDPPPIVLGVAPLRGRGGGLCCGHAVQSTLPIKMAF